MAYAWGDERPYNSYSHWMRQRFGRRVQVIGIDGGFSCPNRDGTLGTQGCAFCNNEAFSPTYGTTGDIAAQLAAGSDFYLQRRPKERPLFLAYLQSFSGTYAPVDILRSRYEEALASPNVAGLIIGTRPDCVNDEVLDLIASLSQRHFIAIEYGIESIFDTTLQRVRRGHDFACSRNAIEATAKRNIPCGGHIIVGLPGEGPSEALKTIDTINHLPLNHLKIHQLQILRNSAFEHDNEWYRPWGLEEYVTMVCDMLEHLRPDMVVARLAAEVPPRFHAITNAGWQKDGKRVKYETLVALIEEELRRRNTHQGCSYVTNPPLTDSPCAKGANL